YSLCRLRATSPRSSPLYRGFESCLRSRSALLARLLPLHPPPAYSAATGLPLHCYSRLPPLRFPRVAPAIPDNATLADRARQRSSRIRGSSSKRRLPKLLRSPGERAARGRDWYE